MADMLKDPRFSHISRDPKFRRIPKKERMVKIDKRFKAMFTDKKFVVNHTIDKRGRPISTSSAVDLKKFYDQSSSDEENEKEEEDEDEENDTDQEEEAAIADKKVTKKQEKTSKTSAKKLKKIEPKKQKELKSKTNKLLLKNKKNDAELSDDSSKSLEEADEELKNNDAQLNLKIKNTDKKVDADTKKKLKDLACDYARGEGVLFSDSSSSDESSEEEDAHEEEEVEHNWGELDKEAETTEEITSRLAACNMDWDKIRAVDLMVLFNSFLQAGGLVHSVTIYPSEYGLQRMQEEDVKGPIELVDSSRQINNDDEDSDENDNEEGSAYTMEKMRQYQLNRLKYYYAVIKFDSATTANKIYTECDGIEYESTSTKLDLRFIPEDMEFEHAPKEFCDKLPDPSKYVPRLHTTTALQQVKVELTWDETKPERQEITQKLNSGKIDDIDDNDIQAYLASGTSDEESDGEQEEKEGESGSDNDENNKKSTLDKYKLLLQSINEKEEEKKKKDIGLEFTWGLGEKEKAEKLVKERMKNAEELTPFDKFLEKRREKKKLKREEKKKKKQSGDDGSDSEDSIPSDVDMNDPFFAEEMKNRKTNKISKKNKNHSDDDDDDDDVDEEEEAQRKAELELLLLDGDDEQDKQHFNMKQIEENEALTKSKKKRLMKKQKNKKSAVEEDNFEVDVNDSRFAALYSSHHFNIDPADPHYRKTKGSEALIGEKLKRRAQGDISSDVPEKIAKQSKETKMKNELAALVKSIKRNTKNNVSQKIKK